jgi:hypothetical protein
MSVFTVGLKNQPGELARLCEAMAGRGVNLIVCATARGEDGAGRRRPRVHQAPGADHPDGKSARAGAATFRRLADAGVNADLLVPVRVSDDLFFAVICVDDPSKARRALGVQVISEDDFVL